MSDYTMLEINRALKVALRVMDKRYHEILDKYAISYMSNDLDYMLELEYVITQNDLDMNYDDLVKVALEAFCEDLGIETYRGETYEDVVNRHFDKATAGYIYNTLEKQANNYVKYIPLTVPDRLAEMTSEKFGVSVDWQSTSDLKHGRKRTFILTAKGYYRDDDYEDDE